MTKKIRVWLPWVLLAGTFLYFRHQLSGIRQELASLPAWYHEMPAEPIPVRAVAVNLPDSLSFAGEPVPLHLPDVRERLDRELHINTYWHTNTIFLLKRAHRWLPRISAILREEGIPDDFKYIPAIESAFRNDISPRQAVGFWQFRKDAALEYGLEVNRQVDERYDPEKATRAACRYFRKAYGKFGSWTLAAASFNRGRAGLLRAMEQQQVDNYYDLMLNEETSRYIFRILAVKEVIEHPLRYGFFLDPQQLYRPEQVRYVEVSHTVVNWAEWARQQGINLKILKRHNPWILGSRLSVPEGKVYRVALPLQ